MPVKGVNIFLLNNQKNRMTSSWNPGMLSCPQAMLCWLVSPTLSLGLTPGSADASPQNPSHLYRCPVTGVCLTCIATIVISKELNFFSPTSFTKSLTHVLKQLQQQKYNKATQGDNLYSLPAFSLLSFHAFLSPTFLSLL